MRNIKFLFLIIILIGLVFFFVTSQNKGQTQSQNQGKQSSASEISTHPVGLYVGGNFVQVGQGEIIINPCGVECPRPSMQLDKTSHPELFKIYNEFTRIEIQGVHTLSNKDFIFITNNIPDYGDYATLYGVIIDPSASNVVYTTPKELASPLASYQVLESAGVIIFDMNPYLFNNSCTSCRLGILETVRYDDKLKKYVSANVGSIPGFKQILQEYEKASKSCYYQDQERIVDEVISLGGKDARCGDGNMQNKPFSADSGAITVGEFQEIRSKIQRIINGEELSLAHY